MLKRFEFQRFPSNCVLFFVRHITLTLPILKASLRNIKQIIEKPNRILGDWWEVGGGVRRRRSNLLSVGILLKPLHTKISMHILHTVFYTILRVLTRRICSTIKRFLMTLMCDSREIRC